MDLPFLFLTVTVHTTVLRLLPLHRTGAHAQYRVNRANADNTGEDKNSCQNQQYRTEYTGHDFGEEQGREHYSQDDANAFVEISNVLFHDLKLCGLIK